MVRMIMCTVFLFVSSILTIDSMEENHYKMSLKLKWKERREQS